MTSRRTMTRSFSGNGRTSSFSEEEGSSSSSRSESRNTYLSNVRPENSYSRYSHYKPKRSTLCSVMAQLTEDIQPTFETTLKPKAVSENCNVKFSCVVSGYPTPELKWYKDDVEMDRYCGLPKYEIRRNGKTHTLHIYNCTLDDAAIYQVSASNSKGIVSCSGVLEVGTMNEYKIHQRFFAKLKQKAERKKKDLEDQTKKVSKENIQKKELQRSPEHPQRKRSIPLADKLSVELPGEAAIPNGIGSDLKDTDTSPINVECRPEETLARKRIRISNVVNVEPQESSNSGSDRTHIMGNGGENCYDGGIGLAQFLAETLQSQTAEERPILPEEELPKDMDTSTCRENKEKDQEEMRNKSNNQEKALQEEHKKDKRTEEELVVDREKQQEMMHATAHGKWSSDVNNQNKGHKDHDPHHIQASISSMFHSVKDFFFGKGKKDSRDNIENEDKELNKSNTKVQPCQLDMPPSFHLQPEHTQLTQESVSMEVEKTEHNPEVCKPLTEEPAPPVMDKSNDISFPLSMEQQSAPIERLEFKDDFLHKEMQTKHKLSPNIIQERTSKRNVEANDAAEAMKVSVEQENSKPLEDKSLLGLPIHTEANGMISEVVSADKEESNTNVVSEEPNLKAGTDISSPKEDLSDLPHFQVPLKEDCPLKPTLPNLENWQPPSESFVSATDGHILEIGDNGVNTMGDKRQSNTEKSQSPNNLFGEEKDEVKSTEPPFSDINRSDLTKITVSSLEDKMELCESGTPDQVQSTFSATRAKDTIADHFKNENEQVSVVQKSDGGSSLTGAPLKNIDLQKLHGHTSAIGELTKVNDDGTIQSSNSTFTQSQEVFDRKLKEQLEFVLDKNLEKYMCNGLKTQDRTQEKVGIAQNERLHPELKTEKNISVNVEVLDESKSISLFQNNGGDDNLIQEHTNMRGLSGGLGYASENVPKIQISDTDDISDKKLFTEDFSPDNYVGFPKTKIIDPEIKETTLPLTILALSKLESSHLQKHDTTHESDISTQHDSEPDCPVPFSTPSIHDLSPTQKVKEVAQSLFEQQELHVQSSEKPHQLDNTSIPVINVMDTEDKENGALSTDSKVQQVCEVSRVPLIVVPPISVTCHESDSEPSQSKCREKETSADTQRGTKSVDNTMKSERIQTCGSNDISEKSRSDKTPIMLSETLIPIVGVNVQSLNEPPDKNSGPDLSKPKPLKEIKTEIPQSVEDYLKSKPSIERLSSKPPTYPSLSPASLRKFMTKTVLDSENDPSSSVPVISVSDHQSDKTEEDLSGGSTPTSSLSCESSPRLKRRDSLTLIRSATPEELASGARRKIFISKTKEEMEGSMFGMQDNKKESPYMSPSQARRAALLQPSIGQKTPPVERRSPLLSRRKATLDVPKVMEEPSAGEPVGSKTEDKLAEKKIDPLKAPQVIRKIRAEPFPDASGHLKLWCQFFNVLTDSTIKWYKDDDEILEIKRSGGDESQVALAIVLASNQDCGVYGCTISNDYGSDTTDFLLSSDVLSEILLKDDLEVGEEIEMTPLLFTRGLADCGSWGEKYFGRIFTEALQVGEGCTHKTSRVKVIYGLDPVFESGSTCIIKIQNPIAYGNRQETNLIERNLDITKQECKVQNLIREYCKIFAAEARVIENFGCSLEVIPRYLMYRPANSVPYATVEADLSADLSATFTKYCTMGPKDQLISQNTSEIEQKCCTFQHWIHQWTHGNLLVTQLEGVETKLTNVKVVTKSKGYQGLTECGSPQVFDQFLTHHQCTYYCGLLGLRPLRSLDTLQQPAKIKGSKSPLLNRKLSTGSPQLQRKGQSPQMSRKGNSSPKVAKKVQATDDSKTGGEISLQRVNLSLK
ncbi:alpha-protein kinase 3 isoform X3 [Oryzias latipes]|uniref:non-specific serine/threonine protein kinase n=1 Tax=Oryzias latipes TaxID=8090 RepID=H2LVH6_ORYLA|nr:alpha-protein kinase 3 isoform X3 [Oryzias latipes]